MTHVVQRSSRKLRPLHQHAVQWRHGHAEGPAHHQQQQPLPLHPEEAVKPTFNTRSQVQVSLSVTHRTETFTDDTLFSIYWSYFNLFIWMQDFYLKVYSKCVSTSPALKELRSPVYLVVSSGLKRKQIKLKTYNLHNCICRVKGTLKI